MVLPEPRYIEASVLSAARHRIVGDLDLVHSMLGLALRRIVDPRAAGLLEATRARVRTISIAHALAAQTGARRTGRVDALALLSEVTLGATVNREAADVEVELKGQRVRVGFDRAVAIGLIAGELVDNALRHAFVNGGSGRVNVDLRGQPNGAALLRVKDDGVGFDEGRFASDSLGFTIVRLLSQQLTAKITVRSSHRGSEFSLHFSRRESERRWPAS